MKIYQGIANKREMLYTLFVVDSENKRKPYRLPQVVKHSPTGMSWGYGGSGPADCALSILADFTGNLEIAEKHYQNFKWDFIAPAGNELYIPGDSIKMWLEKKL